MHISLLGSDTLTTPASTLAEVALDASRTVIECFDTGNWHRARVLMVQTAEEASLGSTTSSAGVTGWIG